jgi:hypothetical protein
MVPLRLLADEFEDLNRDFQGLYMADDVDSLSDDVDSLL